MKYTMLIMFALIMYAHVGYGTEAPDSGTNSEIVAARVVYLQEQIKRKKENVERNYKRLVAAQASGDGARISLESKSYQRSLPKVAEAEKALQDYLTIAITPAKAALWVEQAKKKVSEAEAALKAAKLDLEKAETAQKLLKNV